MQPPLSTQRGRLPVRYLVIGLIVAVSVVIFASPAVAGQPTKSQFTVVLSGVITGVCSFPVGVDSTLSGTETVFVDASGALTKIHRHIVEQDTFTANGKTLAGIPFTFNVNILFDSSGNVTHIFADGIVEKIPLPDGSLFISAGRLDFAAHPDLEYILSPDNGNPGNIAGFCAALAP